MEKSAPNLPVAAQRCLHCQAYKHRKMGYLTVADERKPHQLQFCSICQRYLKIIVTSGPIPVADLLLEDLSTHQLDTLAKQWGFLPSHFDGYDRPTSLRSRTK